MKGANLGMGISRVLLDFAFLELVALPVAALSFFIAVEVAVSNPCDHLSRSDAWLPNKSVMKRHSAVTRKHRRLSHTRMPLPCGGPLCGLPVLSRVQIAGGPAGSTVSVRGGRVYRSFCEQAEGPAGSVRTQPSHVSSRVYRSFCVCRSRRGRQGVHRVQPRHASRR